MRDIFEGSRRAKLIDWLKIDSWIDSGLYSSWTGFRDWWSAYSSFFGKFEVKGFVRALNELACETLTLSVGGLLVVTTFALPAFEIAQGKINLADEYSVTFLDRYGNEIGKRGLLRDDSVPLEEIPDYMIKATLATEDRRFFEHFGVDVMGTFRALAANARHDTVVQGGSSLTQQLAKNMFLSPERSLSRKIKEAFIAVYLENHYTKPEILRAVIRLCRKAGASEINALSWQPAKQWEDTGLKAVLDAEGAGLRIFEKDESLFKPVPVPNGVALKEARVLAALFDHDVLINMPITKDHAGNRFTGTLKNQMGLNSRASSRSSTRSRARLAS